MRSLQMLGVQVNSSIWLCHENAFGFEENVTFLMKFAFYDEPIILAFDAEILNGRVGSGQHVFIQHLRESIATDRNLRRRQSEREGILVVEYDDCSRSSGKKRALQSDDVYGYRLCVVIGHVPHGNLHRLGGWFCVHLSPGAISRMDSCKEEYRQADGPDGGGESHRE